MTQYTIFAAVEAGTAEIVKRDFMIFVDSPQSDAEALDKFTRGLSRLRKRSDLALKSIRNNT